MPREDLRARIKALTGGRGVDVVYDPVGGDYSEPALRGMAWNGRFLVVGFAAGAIPSLPLNLPLLKGCADGRRVLGRASRATNPSATGRTWRNCGPGPPPASSGRTSRRAIRSNAPPMRCRH